MTAPTIPEGSTRHDGGECPVPGESYPTVIFDTGVTRNDVRASSWECVSLTRDFGDETNLWKKDRHGKSCIIAYKPDPSYAPPIDWQARAEKAEISPAPPSQNGRESREDL